jgi:hypothetical protein
MSGPVKLYGSVSGLFQKMVTNAGTNENMWGVDGCIKAGVAGFDFLGYYYYAEGMTSLAIAGLVFPAFAQVGGVEKVEQTNGYMAQAMYTMGKVRFGANWAQSWQLELTRVRNDKLTLGVYYNLTPALQIIAEYSHMQSKRKISGYKDTADAADVGAILFF